MLIGLRGPTVQKPWFCCTSSPWAGTYLFWGYKLSRAEELLKVSVVCTTVCNFVSEREDVTLDPNKVTCPAWSASWLAGEVNRYPVVHTSARGLSAPRSAAGSSRRPQA